MLRWRAADECPPASVQTGRPIKVGDLWLRQLWRHWLAPLVRGILLLLLRVFRQQERSCRRSSHGRLLLAHGGHLSCSFLSYGGRIDEQAVSFRSDHEPKAPHPTPYIQLIRPFTGIPYSSTCLKYSTAVPYVQTVMYSQTWATAVVSLLGCTDAASLLRLTHTERTESRTSICLSSTLRLDGNSRQVPCIAFIQVLGHTKDPHLHMSTIISAKATRRRKIVTDATTMTMSSVWSICFRPRLLLDAAMLRAWNLPSNIAFREVGDGGRQGGN